MTERDAGVWPSDDLPTGWTWTPFLEVFRDITTSDKKLKQSLYLSAGTFPVVDQGQVKVAGYSNDRDLVHPATKPVIVFGDHTRCVKYIHPPFIQGADGVKVLEPTPAITPKFAFWGLSTIRLPDKGYSRHFKFLKESSFPVPPLNEQHRIVAKIEELSDRSRRAREALDAVPALLDRFRQSVLAAAFRGDLTAEWRAKNPDVEPASVLLEQIRQERRLGWTARRSATGRSSTSRYPKPLEIEEEGLPALPQGWMWVTLDELLVGIEAGKSPGGAGRPAIEGEVGVLKVSAVTWGKFNPSENKSLGAEFEVGSIPTVRTGDLLISRANTVELVGAVVVAEADYPNLILCDKTLRLIPASSEVDPYFLMFALRTRLTRAIFEKATGTSDSMRNITQDTIRSVPIALPPRAEQALIVASLKQAGIAIESVGAAVMSETHRLAHLEQSILAKAFRGELVPQDPNDEPASALLERIRSERSQAIVSKTKQGWTSKKTSERQTLSV